MKRETILNQIQLARNAHIEWVNKAKFLIDGFHIQEEAIPLKSTECRFGKWFYSDGQKLSEIRNNPIESMNEVERLHFKIHDIYFNIFIIFYGKEKKSLISKVLSKRKKVTNEERLLAKEHFEDLQEVSKELIKTLNILEKRIKVIGEDEFKDL